MPSRSMPSCSMGRRHVPVQDLLCGRGVSACDRVGDGRMGCRGHGHVTAFARGARDAHAHRSLELSPGLEEDRVAGEFTVIAFLARPESGCLTGVTCDVNGGSHIQ